MLESFTGFFLAKCILHIGLIKIKYIQPYVIYIVSFVFYYETRL